ncbi:putative zinc metalloprotease [Marinobacterium nitratireducens]|uniref:Zinc metalloprotease n=1 Tax=Marinobacterium nitratireducens TaxID=518897 RepID=A0A917Z9B2_9GAMM|nr:sigma E protease regulator RseP [Marinobacterium nitratireducens]GGO78836.1 putative zinc metalloprotease [Marinobacterium nitratireducens]
MSILTTVLAFVATLGVLVTIHEWGHFWVARRCGVRVLRFSVGFGKPLWSRKGRNGTEYVVAAIPLGGYVKMLDEREGEVPESLRDQAFNNKPLWARSAIVAAGPVVNLLFALLAYWFMFVAGVNTVAPVIGEVRTDTPAWQAGIEPGGEVVGLDGDPARSWEELNLLLVSHIGESRTLSLRVRYNDSATPVTYPIRLDDWSVDIERESPLRALGLVPYRPEIPPVLGQLLPDGRAAVAGLQSGDRVLSIDGTAVPDWGALVERVRAAPDVALQLEIERDGIRRELTLTPARRDGETGAIGYIGAGVQAVEWPPELLRTLRYGPLEAFGVAADKTGQMIGLTLESIWKMLEGVISVKNLSGPITIAKVAGASAASGLESFISFLAYLSISLGVLNLLPIPMLDGGHLFYYGIEALRGRPVSERVQMFGLRVGMAVLFTLMAVAIVNDLMRL